MTTESDGWPQRRDLGEEVWASFVGLNMGEKWKEMVVRVMEKWLADSAGDRGGRVATEVGGGVAVILMVDQAKSKLLLAVKDPNGAGYEVRWSECGWKWTGLAATGVNCWDFWLMEPEGETKFSCVEAAIMGGVNHERKLVEVSLDLTDGK